MLILGFSYWGGSAADAHDSSAALVLDGQLIAAAEEERFSRRKHDGAVPLKAIEFCLAQAGATLRDVDVLAFPDLPFRSGRGSYLAEADDEFVRVIAGAGPRGWRTRLHRRLLQSGMSRLQLPRAAMQRDFLEGFRAVRERFGPLPGDIRYYDHHRCHAAAAYFTSGLERAAVATMDNVGGPYASVTWRAAGRSMERLRAEPAWNSLGAFYHLCTRYAGLGDFGEGKLMGLAPYGDPERFRGRVAALLDAGADPWYRYLHAPAPDVLGFAPRAGEPILEGPYADFAAAAQEALEAAISRVVTAAEAGTGDAPLCLGGGVTLNCSANGRLVAAGIVPDLHLFPATGDGGLSVGAALQAAAECGAAPMDRLRDAYWGPGFPRAKLEAALRACPGVRWEQRPDAVERAAESLASGEVVGWFHGRMEMGPRALGNRSILADPRSEAIRDRVNRIKNRELWRPLAPMVPLARAGEFFDLAGPSPFMLRAVQVLPAARRRIPAVVHVDGSARPQTVAPEQNPLLHALLLAFERRAGVPVLLNTSFNDADEPIVCTPEDALATFLRTGLDALFLGEFEVRRADVPDGEACA